MSPLAYRKAYAGYSAQQGSAQIGDLLRKVALKILSRNIILYSMISTTHFES